MAHMVKLVGLSVRVYGSEPITHAFGVCDAVFVLEVPVDLLNKGHLAVDGRLDETGLLVQLILLLRVERLDGLE